MCLKLSSLANYGDVSEVSGGEHVQEVLADVLLLCVDLDHLVETVSAACSLLLTLELHHTQDVQLVVGK